jgi:hypothetical protein
LGSIVSAAPQSRSLLEKIIAAVIVKTFLAFYEARWVIDHHYWQASLITEAIAYSDFGKVSASNSRNY